MDKNEPDCKASSSLFGRYRSPTFKQQEVNTLLQLIEKHKKVLLNKSTNASASYAKDKVWAVVAKEINKLGVGPERSPDVLKTKWENLKRLARKLSKDVMDEDCDFNRDEINKTIKLIRDEDNDDQGTSLKALIGCDDGAEFKLWASDVEQDISPFTLDEDHTEIEKDTFKRFEASPRFSSQECRILLQCVRQEKNVLFSKTSLFKRHQAWKRIANSYNSQSPRKRTLKELSSKFNTLKSMAKRVNVKGYFKDKKRKKYEQLCEDMKPDVEKIKSEPLVDCIPDFDMESDDDIVLNDLVDRRNSNERLFAQDPLVPHGSNSDSGLGSCPETKDASRLKTELLNYKMETARLERKRVEEAIKGEQKEREMRALEQSLRLRAARLELAAAEAKLPSSHPALKYSLEEKVLY